MSGYQSGTMCGVILKDRTDCPEFVVAGATVNLCATHLEAAYEFVSDNRGSYVAPMPAACVLCGSKLGRNFPDGWTCEHCGLRVGDPKPEGKLKAPRVEVVYYLRFGNRIKIGTSGNPRSRFLALPYDEVLAFERGGLTKEQARHEQFAVSRVGTTEWFHPDPALLTHIKKLQAGVSDVWAQYDFWVRREAAAG